MFCPYCGRERPDDESTAEHVIPQAVGGAVEPVNPFILRVCKRCNSACGHFVDGPFVRSWLIQNRRQLNALEHTVLDPSTVFPLGYNGILSETIEPGLDCDYWRGPTGDSIFHFHLPYLEAAGPGAIGRPTNIRKDQFDPGFVLLFVVGSNPVWHQPIINSVVNHFRGATVYLANGPCPGPPLSPIPENKARLRDELKKRMQGSIQVEVPLGLDFGHRFAAKLALGIGALFLEPEFIRSPDATLLRNAMWERDFDARALIPLAGGDFLRTSSQHLSDALDWPSGHLILLLQLQQHLCVCPLFYGQLAAVVRITSDSRLWNSRIDPAGTVYVFAPGLRRVVGPVSLATFVASRQFRTDRASEELSRLFEDIDAIPRLPDVHIGDLDEIEAIQRERVRQRVRELAYELWAIRGALGDPLTDWLEAKRRFGIFDESI